MTVVHHYPPTGNYCVNTFFYKAAGKDMSFRLWYTGDGPVIQPYNPDTAALAFYNHIKTDILDVFNVGVTLLGSTISVRNALLEFSGQQVAGDAGAASGVVMPDEVNAVLRKIT